MSSIVWAAASQTDPGRIPKTTHTDANKSPYLIDARML
jgi:hypothetical protein